LSLLPQRRSVTSAGLWIIPLVGPASAQKRLAQPTESITRHRISASRPSDHR
jgi:hypothetical protein